MVVHGQRLILILGLPIFKDAVVSTLRYVQSYTVCAILYEVRIRPRKAYNKLMTKQYMPHVMTDRGA